MAFLIGAFVPFLILFLLIIVHELGHFLTAFLFGIELDKIYIYPFGGVSKFNLSLNESLLKEFIVLLMGPLSQFIFYLIIIKLPFFDHYIEIIKVYNYSILGFNLLPIYPLDGGKLVNIVLCLTSSFKKSLTITLIISYLTVFLLFGFYISSDISLNVFIIVSFLLFKINQEWKNKNYLMDKFLLERYLYKYRFKKRKKVNNINEFMRNRSHLVKIGDRYHTEKELLEKKFNNKY